ncbi:MAG: aminotransferase class V-fold PLP-dependent enzyme [Gemmataceae bacterium]|nr:aminotransferase class V-fold PLP-dependent enzyme [Gemmataceae bacterium]
MEWLSVDARGIVLTPSPSKGVGPLSPSPSKGEGRGGGDGAADGFTASAAPPTLTLPLPGGGDKTLSPSPSKREGRGGGDGAADGLLASAVPPTLTLPLSGGGKKSWESVRLLTLQLANHETGAIQPVRSFVEFGIPVHTDAAQAVGKIPVNFRELGVTTLSLSAHKFRGPKGVGALLVKSGTKLRPLAFGGHQQRGLRPGTEPVGLAVGMAVALEHAVRTMAETAERLTRLRRRLLEQLRRKVPPVVVNGPLPGDADSLPTTLNLSFPGCRADLLLMALDLAGVACSTGSACSSGSLLPSPVIAAIRVPDDVLRSAMRFSFGETTTEAEIDEAGTRIAACVRTGRGV